MYRKIAFLTAKHGSGSNELTFAEASVGETK